MLLVKHSEQRMFVVLRMEQKIIRKEQKNHKEGMKKS
jgi:hypothetical protein